MSDNEGKLKNADTCSETTGKVDNYKELRYIAGPPKLNPDRRLPIEIVDQLISLKCTNKILNTNEEVQDFLINVLLYCPAYYDLGRTHNRNTPRRNYIFCIFEDCKVDMEIKAREFVITRIGQLEAGKGLKYNLELFCFDEIKFIVLYLVGIEKSWLIEFITDYFKVASCDYIICSSNPDLVELVEEVDPDFIILEGCITREVKLQFEKYITITPYVRFAKNKRSMLDGMWRSILIADKKHLSQKVTKFLDLYRDFGHGEFNEKIKILLRLRKRWHQQYFHGPRCEVGYDFIKAAISIIKEDLTFQQKFLKIDHLFEMGLFNNLSSEFSLEVSDFLAG
ncbi:uncharacterized protein KGF55_001891 [Candida pseudojiufengensis]|uniref:uncharacterized protein n=1 Tax=Candida pseudojiufengensis TaxID=497109 RepID=UPI002224567A|nr:uncharacterized protein KGF55_001891 [Candida pseudojiufengensis]KAI5964821.1 hypothetical protein KGF55_001891 [Candida pseudojiufengensis]